MNNTKCANVLFFQNNSTCNWFTKCSSTFSWGSGKHDCSAIFTGKQELITRWEMDWIFSSYATANNSLRPRQNGRHFAADIFNCIFLNENVWIPIKISLKFVPNGPINNIPALVQIMAWRRTGDKPLSEPMMTQFNDAYMRHSASMR